MLFHLMGDPIDTNWSLLYNLCVAQARATYWKKRVEEYPKDETDEQWKEKAEGDWKALALITVSFDEWGLGEKAAIFLDRQL